MNEKDCGSCDYQGRVEQKRRECRVDGIWHERGYICEDFKEYVQGKNESERLAQAIEKKREKEAAANEQSRRKFEEKQAQINRDHAAELTREQLEQERIESVKERRVKMTGIIITAIITFVVTIMAVEWNEVKKYVPFFPRPLIRISYQITENRIGIVFENIGSAPAIYITADITAENGVFSLKEVHSDFELITSGQGGSWTVISGKNILPQQKGVVTLIAQDAGLTLNAPKVKSDSRCKFVDTVKMKWGPEEKEKN